MERAAYRILDANFNRAREALRVMEEYCRFALNSGALSERAKGLRHELCAAVGRLDTGKLLAGRDTAGDVGVGQKVEGQLTRASVKDCFTAAAKRLTEALRALAEMAQIEDKAVADAVERLRYEAYTLEKDIVLFSEPVEKFNRVRLYVIITSNLPAEVLALASQVRRRRGGLHPVAGQGHPRRPAVRPGGRVRRDLPGDGGAEHHQRPGGRRGGRGGRRRAPGPERLTRRAGPPAPACPADHRQEHPLVQGT